jgi:hypothetical protein
VAVREFTADEARRLRVQAQLLTGSDLAPAEVVNRAVALQGQDLPAALRAIAIRSRPGTTLADVRAAFDAGLLVRSWPMRGTLFATTPAWLAALLHFTAERTHRATTLRRVHLNLDDDELVRAREVLAEALSESPLPRSDALALCEKAGIPTADGRGFHILMHLCAGGLAHWGAFDEKGAQQLLTRTVTPPPADPDAALAAVVHDFVAARGPVTEADLAWWTKLPRATLRPAIEAADLTNVRVDGVAAWVIGEPSVPERSGVILAPGFDEWILGYADRSLVATPQMFAALCPGGNGIFRPPVLVDGVVVGTWRPARAKAEPELNLVEKVSVTTRRAIERAIAAWPYG